VARILVVDDEPGIVELLRLNLQHAGHSVRSAGDSQAAAAEVDAALPDLVILDWMLPGTSGVQLARRWRQSTRTRGLPIIMLTAKGGERDLIEGLDAGADDYLAKPFSPSELLARIRSLLRRQVPEAADERLEVGGLALDPATMQVTGQGHSLHLGPTEFRLLRFLMSQPERVHSRAQLLDRVWGDHVFIEERTVDVHIKRLREALAPGGVAEQVQTVRGAGYRLTASARSLN
jgi:two-component system, OmpR family, phosphate regulon response regulator PhoB